MELLHHKKLTVTNGMNTGLPAIRGVGELCADSPGGARHGAPTIAGVAHN